MRRSVATLKTLCILFILCFAIQINNSGAQTMPASIPSQLVLPDTDMELKLMWGGDTMNKKWDPYAALLIPVKLPGCPKEFYMQFDLGAHSSLFYRDKLKQIAEKYPGAVQANDSTSRLYDFRFKSGKNEIVAKEVRVKAFEQTLINWDRKSIVIIGSLGADLIDNKVAVINYPGKKLLISNAVPSRLQSRLQLTEFMLVGRSVLLPAIIKGKKTMLYFDTGSSTFELITDQSTSLALSAPGSVADRYPVNSWGNTMTANTLPSNDSIEIASQKIPLRHVTYFEGFSDSQAAQMMQTGMGGMTGNRLFLQSVLVLDTKNKKFGVVANY